MKTIYDVVNFLGKYPPPFNQLSSPRQSVGSNNQDHSFIEERILTSSDELIFSIYSAGVIKPGDYFYKNSEPVELRDELLVSVVKHLWTGSRDDNNPDHEDSTFVTNGTSVLSCRLSIYRDLLNDLADDGLSDIIISGGKIYYSNVGNTTIYILNPLILITGVPNYSLVIGVMCPGNSHEVEYLFKSFV